MLKLIPRRKRVPNALALLGAFLLVASALGGAGHVMQDSSQSGMAQQEVAGQQDPGVTGELEPADTIREPAVTKTRKFRVNLFLFRN
ncbi:MAG: hypothetical protein ACSLE2_04585 [Lysobacterales bacterium]